MRSYNKLKIMSVTVNEALAERNHMLSQRRRDKKKRTLKLCKFTKLHKLCMYVLIKFFKTLSSLFICELNNVEELFISLCPNN